MLLLLINLYSIHIAPLFFSKPLDVGLNMYYREIGMGKLYLMICAPY